MIYCDRKYIFHKYREIISPQLSSDCLMRIYQFQKIEIHSYAQLDPQRHSRKESIIKTALQ